MKIGISSSLFYVIKSSNAVFAAFELLCNFVGIYTQYKSKFICMHIDIYIYPHIHVYNSITAPLF